jgi:exosome complex RNA-binding protein Csl4
MLIKIKGKETEIVSVKCTRCETTMFIVKKDTWKCPVCKMEFDKKWLEMTNN